MTQKDQTAQSPESNGDEGCLSDDKATRWRRDIVMFFLLLVAIAVILRTTDFAEFGRAFTSANPWWMLATFAFGTITWIGAAIPRFVFAPIKVKFGRVLLTQVASSFAGVVAPSGLGSLAVCVRFFQLQGAPLQVAVSAMMLVELTEFIAAAIMVIAALVALRVSPEIDIDWPTIGWVIIGIVLTLAFLTAIPKLRKWSFAQIKEVWHDFYPRLKSTLQKPKQLAIALAGSLLQTLGFAAALYAGLATFGWRIGFLPVAAAFLIANSIGSMLPVPGGVGTVEASLTAALTLLGVPAAIALSAALTYRLLTFYARIPLGYLALQYMQRKKLV